jgi:hypothetical protein
LTPDERVALIRESHRRVLASPPPEPETWKHREPKRRIWASGRHSPSYVARDYQKRQRAAGLCTKCPLPLATANHCVKHAADHANTQRKGQPPRRVCKCSGCGEPGHQNRTCARRRAVAELAAQGARP